MFLRSLALRAVPVATGLAMTTHAAASPSQTARASAAMPRAAVVVGVSYEPGLGFAVAKRFAEGGLAVGIVGRQPERLEECKRKILESVPNAIVTAVAADATDPAQVEKAFSALRQEHGPADVLVYNLSCRPFPPTAVADLDVSRLESDIKTGPVGALLCVKQVLPSMREAGRGTILFTGASASLRGNAKFGSFTVAKTGLRALAQSLCKEVAADGIHVAHVVVDALVDMPVIHQFFPNASPGRMLDTTSAAQLYWQLYMQDKRCMSFEVDVRPFEAQW